MARDNKINATFTMDSGDGASGFTEATGVHTFTSGDAVLIQGVVGTGEIEHVMADFGISQADGIYFHNRDAASFILISLRSATGSGNNLSSLKIAAGGMMIVRCDVGQDPITHVAVIGEAADAEYSLALSE